MTAQQPSTYDVTCPHCAKSYDAVNADFCRCLSKERTFACPHCDECICKAAPAVRRAFWAKAPDALWKRKHDEQTKGFEFVNPHVSVVTRPLVLIVDDEKEIRAVALEVVSGLGFGAIVAGDGQEGLRLAREYRPQVVLTDAMMPKMDGREMGRQIKEDSAIAAAHVVVMTSLYTDPRYKYEALKEFKADTYVSKPLQQDELREILRKITS